MESTAADLIDGAHYSVGELRRAAFEGSGSLSRALALALLRTKSYPEKVKDLERLLFDEREVPRLRNLAAQLLGEMATPAAVRALGRATDTSEELTLRGVVKGLARAGDRRAQNILRKLAGRSGLLGNLASRVVAPRAKFETPAELAPPGSGTVSKRAARSIWRTIRVRPATARARSAAAKALTGLAAKPRIASRAGILLECEGPPWMLLPADDLTSNLRNLLKGVRRAGLLLRFMEHEVVGWRPRYEITTEPAGDAMFGIAVTTVGSARPFLVGTGHMEGKRASFFVSTFTESKSFQVRIRGTFDGRRLVFDEALVARSRPPARQPGLAR